MKAIIVDDEQAARNRLALMLAELDVEVVAEAADGVEALSLAAALSPDLLLLDIAMPEVDGLDVARHLRAPRPLIIFQTAHPVHAPEAFDHDAVDFLVKPVTLARLQRALERAQARLQLQQRPAFDAALLEKLGSALGNPVSPARAKRLLVLDGAGHRLLNIRDILVFTAEAGVVRAIAATTHFNTEYTLSDLETRTGARFIRASRADLVNLDHVSRVEPGEAGSITLRLSNGRAVHVSRRRVAEVRAALES
jgi:DNA-binding LytR/AlgR family response regulator